MQPNIHLRPLKFLILCVVFLFVYMTSVSSGALHYKHKNNPYNKKKFTKVKLNCDFTNTDKSAFYKLLWVGSNPHLFRCSYHFNITEFTQIKDDVKLEMIEELLSYEGDTDTCSLSIQCYNPARSQVYMAHSQVYSTQIEALFIINLLYFKKPFNYSCFPVLKNKISGELCTSDGIIVHEAYKEYRQWFNKIKKIGIKAAIKKNMNPLNNSIMWY